LLEADLLRRRLSVPPNENQDIIDFLRKLASMLTGGRNAVMLLEAAQAIETQAERAIAVELLHQERQADHARNVELREQAQLLSERLMTEVTALKAQLAENERQAVTEVTALKAQLTESERQAVTGVTALKAQFAESERRAESERTFFAEEVRHLQARLEDANAQLAEASAELDELRKPVTVIDHSIAIVPVDSLQLARTQFDFLAAGFARNGDVISQTICQIGACAIDKALSGNELAEN
jgi:DNA repair exonuclease SbcCD ATPase subunit